uniref:Phospholipase-like protein n=1 Tax=Tanacetum cinerariifolium TaxID=118510 RepID=A0A6L2N754_TANCI|nr:phospholipase-like protein [Tanacetum cinerariifolium]
MTTTAAQQVALDNTLVPLEKRVEIGKCNMRIDPAKTHKESTYQVILDALALTTYYLAFLITADVPDIYMQQFWFTINKKDSTTYRFKIEKNKFKKLASPSKKRTLVIVKEEELEPEPAKKAKAPAKAERSKGIELLSDSALLEEAQLKKVLKRSKRDTNIHQEGGSSERANFELESNNPKTSDDEEETQDDEYVHTPKDYIPTDDETNDVDEEEYDRNDRELYGDVNGIGNQVKDDAQATQKTEVLIPSSSISFDYDVKFINFDNILPVDTEVVSMLDINVQHEAPRTSPLLTILVFIIPEHTVINPFETVTTTSTTTISSLLTLLFPHLQQSTLIPTPTITEATTSTTTVLDSETLTALHQRIVDLEKDVKELKDRNFADIVKEHSVPVEIVEIPRQQYAPQKSIEDILDIKMKHARKKTTLFETMTKSKSFNKSPKQRALYHALMESILEDEDAMDEGVTEKLKKRKPDDADKDKGPSAGSDRGLKICKTSKDTKPSKKAKSIETPKGTSKSQPKSTGKSAQAEKTMFEAGDTQRPHNLREDPGNTNESPVVNIDPKDWLKRPERPLTLDPEWNKGKSIENKPTQKWLSNLPKEEKPSRTFNDLISTPIDFSAFVMNRLQISELTQDILVGPAYNILKSTCRSYVELDYNMEECYKALTNQIDWNNPKGDRYTFDLRKPLPLVMSGNHQIIPIDYYFNNDLAYLQGGSSIRTCMTSLTKTKAANYDLPGIKDMVPNLWSPVKVAYDEHTLLGTSHWGMFTSRIVIQKRVEDLQLGVKSYQKKLNISRPMTYKVGITDLKPYSSYSNPQGFIYVDKLGRNKLMCSHELYKFSDSTLISLCDTLKYMANNLEMGYTSVMQRRRWSNLDKKKARIMIKDIDQHQSDIRVFTMTMKILPEPTSNKLCGRLFFSGVCVNVSIFGCCVNKMDLSDYEVPRVLLKCRSDENENIPLYYHVVDNFQIQFGREEFFLVSGLKFGVENWTDYNDEKEPIPFRRRVFCSSLDGRPIKGKNVETLINSEAFKTLDDNDAQLKDANVRRWSALYATQPKDKVDKKSNLITGFAWAFKTWILESFRVATNDYYTRYSRLPRIVSWSSKNKFYRNMLKPFLHKLVPDENEARSRWWVSSRAYFNGHNIKEKHIHRHLNRNNHFKVSSEMYREFKEQRRGYKQMMEKSDDMCRICNLTNTQEIGDAKIGRNARGNKEKT